MALAVVVGSLGACHSTAEPPRGGGSTPAAAAVTRGPRPPAQIPPSAEPSGPRGEPSAPASEVCDPGLPTALAAAPGGSTDGRTAIIPGGRAVTPDGVLVPLNRAPLGLALSPDGLRAYVTHDRGAAEALWVVDVATGERLQTLGGFTVFRGVVATPDGTRVLIASGADRLLRVLNVGADGLLTPGATVDLGGYLGDVTVSSDSTTAWAVVNTSSAIHEVDLATLTVRRTFFAGNLPYDLVVDRAARRLFVSNYAESTVQVFDTATGDVLATLETPAGPEGMALDAAEERLYVTCADSDQLFVLDARTLLAETTIDLTHHPEGLLASTPNDVSLSPDGTRLYVVQADLNQVDVLDAASGTLLGSLPTGWYPVAVGVPPDGQHLVVLNHKGLGAVPGEVEPSGNLQIVPVPADAESLGVSTDQVWQNNSRPSRFFPGDCDRPGRPASALPPIEHVVLLVRENKTYDQVLGDVEGTNGDPALTLFGEAITPNLHALAKGFSNLDNYYSNPEESLQGHQWTTQSDCGDFTEKLRHSQSPLSGYEGPSLAASGSIFHHCLDHGVSFRNYGEVVSFGPELLGRLRDFIDPKYPFFNMGIRDQDKAHEILREWSLGIFPEFIYISLPNDHTFGAEPGKPTPESMVADNDRATGMLVDWISKSAYWEKTIVFIIEDDPQSHAGDHVDAHRSIAVVVSPWVKRGHVSHVHHDIPSIYRTIELLLGLPPMNKWDAGASAMYDLFLPAGTPPDLTPFDALPLGVPPGIVPEGAVAARFRRPRAASAEAGDGDADDRDDDEKGVDGRAGLGRELWHYFKGDREPPPYAKGIDR